MTLKKKSSRRQELLTHPRHLQATAFRKERKGQHLIDLYKSDTDLRWEQASAQYDMEEQDLETRSGEDCLFCRAVNFETIQDIISRLHIEEGGGNKPGNW